MIAKQHAFLSLKNITPIGHAPVKFGNTKCEYQYFKLTYIASCDWGSRITNADNMDFSTFNFSTKNVSLVRGCIPEKKVISNKKEIRPKGKPWFDSTLRKTIRKRDRLRNIALKHKCESDWSKHRKIRNQVNNMKKHARSNCYDNFDIYLHEAHKDNTSLYWKLLKYTFKTNSISNIPPIHHTSEDGDNFVVFCRFEKSRTI